MIIRTLQPASFDSCSELAPGSSLPFPTPPFALFLRHPYYFDTKVFFEFREAGTRFLEAKFPLPNVCCASYTSSNMANKFHKGWGMALWQPRAWAKVDDAVECHSQLYYHYGEFRSTEALVLCYPVVIFGNFLSQDTILGNRIHLGGKSLICNSMIEVFSRSLVRDLSKPHHGNRHIGCVIHGQRNRARI